MPFPFGPIIVVTAAVALAAAVLSSKKKKARKSRKGYAGKEGGTLIERLKDNCSKHSEGCNRFYFSRYVPWKHNQGSNSDSHSENILKLKEKDKKAIDQFVRKFKFLKGLNDLVLVRVPSHKQYERNGVELLSERISARYGIVDRSSNLSRISDVAQRKRAKPGNRFMDPTEKHMIMKSLKIIEPELFDGKEVLLLDDVATTWDSIDCCESILARDCRPVSICSLVLGRTNMPRRI